MNVPICQNPIPCLPCYLHSSQLRALEHLMVEVIFSDREAVLKPDGILFEHKVCRMYGVRGLLCL